MTCWKRGDSSGEEGATREEEVGPVEGDVVDGEEMKVGKVGKRLSSILMVGGSWKMRKGESRRGIEG